MARKRRKPLNHTVAFDGTPVFRGLARMLQDARKNGWSGSLTSADRRRGVPEKYGKLSQYALYMGWLARRPGFNPANPPGYSTHELRTASGRPLPWWGLGMDVTESDELVRVLNRLGYSAYKPYSSPSEQHHINLRRNPRRNLIKRGLHPRRTW